MELMQECAKSHTTYFINFSDGEPGCAFKHEVGRLTRVVITPTSRRRIWFVRCVRMGFV